MERRSAQHLLALAGLGDVTLVTPQKAADDLVDKSAAAGLAVKNWITRPDRAPASARQDAYAKANGPLARFWRALGLRHPSDQAAFSADAEQFLSRVNPADFDLLYAFRLSSAVWADSVFTGRARKPRFSVVDFDDIEPEGLRRHLETSEPPPLFWRMINSGFVRWLEQTETKLLRTWSGVAVCSEIDRANLLKREPAAHVQVVPNAVRFAKPGSARRADDDFRVLFVGALDYPPNVQGVTWLLDQVWPALRQALGERVSIDIVGFNPPPDLHERDGAQGVNIRGYVKNLDEYYANADLAVAPIFSGAGTRIKIIEAWAHSTPVVTTTIGCEGLQVTQSKEALVADTPEAFAAAILDLARNAAARADLAQAGYAAAKARFDLDQVVRAERAWLAAMLASSAAA